MTAAVTGGHHRVGGSRCRSDSVDLAAHPAVVAQARLRSRLVLRDWGLETRSEPVAQVVSELVGNAVQATRDAGLNAGIRLTLTADDSGIVVAVWDAAPARPSPALLAPSLLAPAEPDLDSEHGRGLLIVAALSESYGVVPVSPAHGGGKIVRARIALSGAR